jgi:hypothetical protein
MAVREKGDAGSNSTVGFAFLDQSRSNSEQNSEHKLTGGPILLALPGCAAPIAEPKES